MSTPLTISQGGNAPRLSLAPHHEAPEKPHSGVFEQVAIAHPRVFTFRTSAGKTIVRLELDSAVYLPAELKSILAWLQRELVDPVDPALALVHEGATP